MAGDKKGSGRRRIDTRIAHAGRDPVKTGGMVNPQIQRGSTVLVDKAADLYAPGGWTYGRHGTATHAALREVLAEIEGATHCQLTPSGLLACSLPMFALTTSGSHILVTDNAYGPTRRFCERTLKRWGVETEFFDPRIGAAIKEKFRPETKLIFLESPGSLSFEISDASAIADVARKANIVTVQDNTWCAGLFHRPLDLGIDISVQSTSKYASGGADVLGGAVITNDDKLAAAVKESATDLGLAVSPDDAWLVMRGLRTLPSRMARCESSALEVAQWLARRDEVDSVLHPALPDHPDHELWKRDFTGASGLFGLVLKPAGTKQVHAFLDALELFGLGFSYGGFESLAIHSDPQLKRTFKPKFGGPLIRLSIGLEDPADLCADLERGLFALKG